MNSSMQLPTCTKVVLRMCVFVVQDESDVLNALRRLEEMHISVEALKVIF